ncbi:hypothetical protein BKM35_22125 [Salmonella enterica]|nr:hypothetical protein [Salmonella enterica]
MKLTLEVDVGQEVAVGDNVTIRLQHKTGRKARLVFVSSGERVPIKLREISQNSSIGTNNREPQKH